MLYWITGLWGQLHLSKSDSAGGVSTLQADDAFSRNLRRSFACCDARPAWLPERLVRLRKRCSRCCAPYDSHSEVRRYTIQ